MENTPSVVDPIIELEIRALTEREQNEFLEFYRDFDKKLMDLQDALSTSKSVQSLADTLKNKGVLNNLWGSFSGSNDKELAEMVKYLGGSLETTQIILELVMKVQNIKNKFLRDFHKALVEKIVLINNDTAMLDTNQRQAAIAIVSELRDQVADQIEQQAIVENHQKKLQQLDGYVVQKDVLDEEQSEKIRSLENRAQQIIRTDEEHQRLIEELKAAHASKDELDRIQTQRIDTLSMTVIDLEVDSEKHQRAIGLLESQQSLMAQQLRALDAAYREQTSIRAVIMRNLLPGTAFLIGLLGLLASIR